MSLTVVTFDKTPRSTIERGTLVHHLLKGHALYCSGYKLEQRIVRGRKSISLFAPVPGEDSFTEYRPILNGKKALKVALELQRLQDQSMDTIEFVRGKYRAGTRHLKDSWSLNDNERIHEFTEEHGEYEPDYTDPTPVWEYGY